MAFIPPQSRPYDPRLRPRVGEWVYVPVSGALPQTPLNGQSNPAQTRPEGAKTPYVLYAVIAVVALALVFAVAKIVGGKSKPAPVQVSGGQPDDVSAAIKGKPRATVYGKRTEGDILTVLFSYSLGSDSRTINQSKPAKINFSGCEPESVTLTSDDKIQVRVRLIGDGLVKISKIRLSDGTLLEAESQQQVFSYSKPKPVDTKQSGATGSGAGPGSRRDPATSSSGPTKDDGSKGKSDIPGGKQPPSTPTPGNPNTGGPRSGGNHGR